MKVDEVIGKIIIDISEQTGLPNEKVLEIIDKYYKGIVLVIETQPPSAIKVDLFGKLMYNNAAKAQWDDAKAAMTPIKANIDFSQLE